jgi:DDE superfamily endonuclease
MIPLLAPLPIVEQYKDVFACVFSPSEFEQFKRYTSGLIINGNKTIESINRLFILDIHHQCTLNRFLTHSDFNASTLNSIRLNWLQACEQTAFKDGEGAKGVLIIDDTLLSHYGNQFEKCAILYDHVSKGYCWAHNLVNLHYSDDQTDYPVDYRLWEPPDLEAVEQALLGIGYKLNEGKVALKTTQPDVWRTYLLREYHRKRLQPYKKAEKGRSTAPITVAHKSKIDYAKDILRNFYKGYAHNNLPIAFDHWYTSADFCQFIDKELQKSYVGTVPNTEKLLIHTTLAGKTQTEVMTCMSFAHRLVEQHHQAIKDKLPPIFEKVGIHYKDKKETYYAYCHTHTLQNLGKQRFVISFETQDLSDEPKFYVSNRLHWRAGGILRIRRHRWPIEVYHEEGKAEGLDKYQVRQFDAIIKHIACVCVTYSMLKRAQFDQDFLNKLQWKPNNKAFSLPFFRRVMFANALIQFLDWFSQSMINGMDKKILVSQIAKVYA